VLEGEASMKSTNSRSIKVMMVGPGSGITGDINILVDTILPHLNSRVQLYYLPTASNRALRKSGRISIRNFLIALDQFSRLRRSIRKFRPQVLHIHTSHGIAWIKDTVYIWIGKLQKCKVILHLHSPDFSRFYSQSSPFSKLYTRYMLIKADAVITISENWKHCLSKILPNTKIITILNCIQSSENTIVQKPDQRVLYGFLGGEPGMQKGAYELVDAIARVNTHDGEVHLCLEGIDGRQGELTTINQKLAELQISDKCELVGEISDEKRREYFQNIDFIIFPSHGGGLPMALLEGMAEGKAIISTSNGGVPEVVEDGYNGFLVEPGDVDNLADKINTLIRRRDLCSQMGIHSLEIVRNKLCVQRYIDQLVGIYEGLFYEFT
jgi:glycosyltransferase involved in cell wall biosynthesis